MVFKELMVPDVSVLLASFEVRKVFKGSMGKMYYAFIIIFDQQESVSSVK